MLAVSDSPLRKGQEFIISDQRPNTDLALTFGLVEDDNPNDCLEYRANLIGADRLYGLKKQIVESEGFSDSQVVRTPSNSLSTISVLYQCASDPSPLYLLISCTTYTQVFPLFMDRFPTQLLNYIRLSRVQDPGELAKVNFKRDNMVSTANEYETLMILMNDCRDRLTAYERDLEEDAKLAAKPEAVKKLNAEEQLALRIRLQEKKILRSTMDALRRRLTPIRGIPTKGGQLEDANADLKEIFDAIEAAPKLPSKIAGEFMSWWRGEKEQR